MPIHNPSTATDPLNPEKTTSTMNPKTITPFLITLLIFGAIVPSAFSDHPSIRGKPLTADEIYANMFDLEGQIIKIIFPTENPRQVSREQFSLNYGQGNQVAVVLIPSTIARKYFAPDARINPPKTLFVEVHIGRLVNEYGAQQEGPILSGIGTRIHREMQGKPSFIW